MCVCVCVCVYAGDGGPSLLSKSVQMGVGEGISVALVGAECKLLFSSTVYIKLMHSTVGCSGFRFWFSYGECFYSVSINSETNPVLNRHTDMAALIPEPVWPSKKASVW